MPNCVLDEKVDPSRDMLAASRPLAVADQTCSSLAMGLSQEHQHFAQENSVSDLYFVLPSRQDSPSLTAGQDSGSESSSDFEIIPEKKDTGVNNASESSASLSLISVTTAGGAVKDSLEGQLMQPPAVSVTQISVSPPPTRAAGSEADANHHAQSPQPEPQPPAATTTKTTDIVYNTKTPPCVKPKHGTAIVGLPGRLLAQVKKAKKKTNKNNKKKNIIKPDNNKKQKKWKPVDAELDMGFKLSLFPRPTVQEDRRITFQEEEDILLTVEAELEVFSRQVQPFCDVLRLEGTGVMRDEKLFRRDRDRREAKAHRQIREGKHITSLLNNSGRKTFHVHFRVYYRHLQLLHCFVHPNLPSPRKHGGVCLDVARSAIRANRIAACQAMSGRGSNRHRQPAQNLAHALDNNNAAGGELPTDIISFLISIQHREMTPEDYEMLLRLDDGVAPKTVDQTVVSNFKMDTVSESTPLGVCSVCMEPYEVGQDRKFLPCEHVFHAECIDTWLTNSSQNCPLDGLPVGLS